MLTTQEWYFPSTRWIYYVCINIIFPPVAVLLYCCTLWRLLFSPRFLSFVCCCCCCWCSLGVVMIPRDCLWLPGWLDSWLVDSGWHSEQKDCKRNPSMVMRRMTTRALYNNRDNRYSQNQRKTVVVRAFDGITGLYACGFENNGMSGR